MPRGLSSRDVVWTATPSDTYRTGKTKFVDGIPCCPFKRRAANRRSGCRPLQTGRKIARGQLPSRQPEVWTDSQDVRSELCQRGTLTFRQGDVSGQALVLELVDHVDEAIAGRVHVRIVDLIRVAGDDDLGVVADAGDDRLHLVRRQVLRFVDDDVLVGNAAPADVRQRLDGDQSQINQLPIAASRLLVRPRKAHQELDVVIDGLHPRVQLLLHRAGKKADVLAERKDGPAHEHLLVDLLLHRLLQACSDGEQRLAGARLPHDGDELDLVVEQEVEREALLLVARPQPPGALFKRLEQRDEAAFLRVVLAERGVVRCVPILEQRELVRVDAVDSVGWRQLAAGVEVVDVALCNLQLAHPHVDLGVLDLVVLVVLGYQPQRVRTDAKVDVLGDEYAAQVRLALLHVDGQGEDAVVGDVLVHQLARKLALGEEHAQRPAVLQRNALGQAAVLLAKGVEIARDLPRVAAQLGEIALELVDLPEEVDGDDDVVVFELEEGPRIVEQDVGVEDVVLSQPGLPGKNEGRSPWTPGEAGFAAQTRFLPPCFAR